MALGRFLDPIIHWNPSPLAKFFTELTSFEIALFSLIEN